MISTDDFYPSLRKAPSHGARRFIYRATRGRINPGPPASEQHRLELERQVHSVLRGNYRILVVGKGGVGKTTIAAGVGSTLAQLRNDDRVVAVDADTAFGKLGSRIDPTAADSFWELVTDPRLDTFADIRSHLGTNTAGLSVLSGAATGRRQLTPELYQQALARLDRYFAVAIIDCRATLDARSSARRPPTSTPPSSSPPRGLTASPPATKACIGSPTTARLTCCAKASSSSTTPTVTPTPKPWPGSPKASPALDVSCSRCRSIDAYAPAG